MIVETDDQSRLEELSENEYELYTKNTAEHCTVCTDHLLFTRY